MTTPPGDWTPEQQPGSTPPPPPSAPQPPASPGYGTPPPPPAYGPPPGYTPPPPAYGATPPGYGAPPPGYAPPPPAYGGPAGIVPGGPGDTGKRTVAAIIDWAIVFVPVFILYFIAAAIFVTSAHCDFTSDNGYECHSGSGGGILALFWLLAFVGILGYYGYMDGVKGATIGKKMQGLKVVDVTTGAPIGLGKGVLRAFLKNLCIIIAISYFFDSQRHRSWSDQASNALVVNA